MRFTYQTGAQPLSGYTIHRGIHRGGFGEVYFAHSDGGKEVALKLLHDQDHETELRGVTQCLNLKHPNLVNIFDLKTDAHGDHWVVMEYVSGSSLEDVLASFPDGLPSGEVRDWLSGLVAGVAHLHDRGIVHRDLKPANVYRENGVVKVGDVGLSKRLDSDHRRQHTQSVGTVYYMAPEVAKGIYGPEVDVYSLGVMLYEMISGKLPFTGETTAEILMKHLTAQPDLTPIPKSLRPVVARALEKDPQRRTPTARQLEHDFLRASGIESEPTTNHESSFVPPQASPKKNGTANQESSPWISIRVNRPFPKQKIFPETTTSSTHGSSGSAWESLSTPWITIPLSLFLMLWILKILSGVGNNGRVIPNVPWLFVLSSIAIFTVVFREFKGKRRVYQTSTRRRESLQAMPETLRTAAMRARSQEIDFPTIHGTNGSFPDMPHVPHPVWTRKTEKTGSCAGRLPRFELLPELASSIGSSGLIASILSTGVYLILHEFHKTSMLPSAEHAVLFVATSVLGSWLLLISHKLTVRSLLTKRQKWLVRLATGALLGTCAYGLNEFLTVHTPTAAYSAKSIVSSIGSRPLTLAGADPTWLGYVVFFAGFLGIRRWSSEMDPCRKKMFSIPLTAASVVMAFGVSLLFEFPQWYAMFWAGTISATLQLASEWTPKSGKGGERCRWDFFSSR